MIQELRLHITYISTDIIYKSKCNVCNKRETCHKKTVQGSHKNLKTKFPDFSLAFTKILTIFSLTFRIILQNFPFTLLLSNGKQLQINLVKPGLKTLLLIYIEIYINII